MSIEENKNKVEEIILKLNELVYYISEEENNFDIQKKILVEIESLSKTIDGKMHEHTLVLQKQLHSFIDKKISSSIKRLCKNF